jgi:putative flavoprotein involved in K+ transport
MWWLDATGVLDQRTDDGFKLNATRNQPSLQLVGRSDHSSLDLGVLQQRGVRLVGRAVAAKENAVSFSGDLATSMSDADAKLRRVLSGIDDFITRRGLDASLPVPRPFAPLTPAPAPTSIDLDAANINTVVWATGFRRSYPWLKVPVLDERGEIRHRGGMTASRGLYVLGLNFMRRRKSTYIDGVGADATDLVEHIAGHPPRDLQVAA